MYTPSLFYKLSLTFVMLLAISNATQAIDNNEVTAYLSTQIKQACSNGAVTSTFKGSELDGNLLKLCRKSLVRIQKTAEQGHKKEQAALGAMYLFGFGVKQDNLLALRWFHAAAMQNSAAGQAGMGYMYENGKGIKQEPANAAPWYTLAANQGVTQIQTKLALMYHEGLGVPLNNTQSIKWLHLAAIQGDSYAQVLLGQIYETGLGVPTQTSLAHMWYSVAALKNNKIAKARQRKLEKSLNTDELASAQELLDQWLDNQ